MWNPDMIEEWIGSPRTVEPFPGYSFLKVGLVSGILGLPGLVVGCSLPESGEVRAPEVDSNAAADKALELYDKDSNSMLDQEELRACPGILSALPRYDTNQDQKVDRDELVSRFTTLFSSGVGLMSVGCTLQRAGSPVIGATVRFVPEEFLGESVQAAAGVTDGSGVARMAVPDDKLPENQRGLKMMQVGVYRVEIETQSGQLARSKQPLGFEADPASRMGSDAMFRLTGR